MNDRELLELAAKAAGYEFDSTNLFEIAQEHKGGTNWIEWNPLTDDGDALRLAVRLGIQPHYSDFTGNAYVRWDRGEKTNAIYGPDDPCAAIRRAIVHAAAEIGKAKS